MTDEQVVATLGAANLVRLDQRANRFEGIHGDTSQVFHDLQLRDLEIGNTPFRALFIMKVGDEGTPKLNEVLLRSVVEFDDKIKSSEVNLIRKILSERFGSPNRHGSSDRVFWHFPTTSITLTYSLPDVVEVWFEPSSNFREAASAI